MIKGKNENRDKNKEDENKINIERTKKEDSTQSDEKNENKNLDEKQEADSELQKSIEEIYIKELEELKNKNETLEKELAGYKDKVLRKAAEFENYKRRTESDQLNLITYAAESFILKILPVYDDLERSLKHLDDENTVEAVKEGLKMVYTKFSKLLDEQGVKKIDAKGKPFDVNFHEALMQRTVEGVEPHTVLEEVEAGYMYKDKVIRHTKVIVSDDGTAS
ncbi:MAG: nucleotide exchange factor GrpE [Ignavibacteriales bacterium]|nr:nucleotide exchange factor GrpE [Ignavibacteriales bacterium]